jgi:hypothetical protein
MFFTLLGTVLALALVVNGGALIVRPVVLIIPPPLISARDDRVRAQLDDAQAFADALTVTEKDLQQMRQMCAAT